MHESDDEFAEDFGATPPDEAELEAMLEEARRTGNDRLRVLHRTLKYVAGGLLERVESEHPGPSDAQIKLARFIVRGQKDS